MPVYTFTSIDFNTNKVFNSEAQTAVCISQVNLECMRTVGEEGVLIPY